MAIFKEKGDEPMAIFKDEISSYVKKNMVRKGISKCRVKYAGKFYYGKNKNELIEIIWESFG